MFFLSKVSSFDSYSKYLKNINNGQTTVGIQYVKNIYTALLLQYTQKPH